MISPVKINLYLLVKLPAAWIMGVRLKTITPQTAAVTLPYKWLSQNPFKSTYFAAQCAAGEFSTGVLAMQALQGKPPVSMLVTHVGAQFFKKADQRLVFSCHDGEALEATISKAIDTNEPQVFTATASGHLPDGTLASTITITWSFKKKKI